jgi:hypothetical protein
MPVRRSTVDDRRRRLLEEFFVICSSAYSAVEPATRYDVFAGTPANLATPRRHTARLIHDLPYSGEQNS